MGVFNFVDDGSLPGCAVLKVITIFVFFLLNYQNELESQIFIENHQAMVSYRNVIEQIELRCNLFNLTRLFKKKSKSNKVKKEIYVIICFC